MGMLIKMRLEKETKGALRYQEIGEDGKPLQDDFVFGTVYIRKSALAGEKPAGLTLDVTYED